ncbi:MAG: endonuclease/exonuclease/phosphatase family protein [Betaproteobacteria bacterium]|nr:endonuclease/exonuclease/phosphatase family protein [Betaproteobacteria bacterium]
MRSFFLTMILSTVIVLTGCAGQSPKDTVARDSLVQCGDVASRGHLNVLSINLLFSETKTRDQRLDAIAEFAKAHSVDVILMQEVAGGILAKTANSALNLQGKLRDQGGEYDLHSAFEVGLPGLLTLANATLSRCDIDFKMVKQLPKTSELEFEKHDIRIPRNIMMTRLTIPDLGKLNVYNTHLCAKCSADEMNSQLDVMLEFIDDVEDFFPQNNPMILGGDFNIDRLRTAPFAEKPFYDRIVAAGFTDAYAEGRILDELCSNTQAADKHCTVGVSNLDIGDSARRVDYIFVNNVDNVRESRVVFNTLIDPSQPTASDHAGVFVSIDLP